MSIKNRDGTIYKLRGPNPFMREQIAWDEFSLHNMNFPGITVLDDQPKIPEIQLETKDFTTELTETKEPVLEKIPEPIPTNTKGLQKIDVHCLPAAIRERSDSLYGEKYQTIQYGNPFVFEAVIFKEEDFFIQMWTNAQSVGRGSVLYPRKGTQRWWKVTEREEKNDGWILTAVVSEYTPSFS